MQQLRVHVYHLVPMHERVGTDFFISVALGFNDTSHNINSYFGLVLQRRTIAPLYTVRSETAFVFW